MIFQSLARKYSLRNNEYTRVLEDVMGTILVATSVGDLPLGRNACTDPDQVLGGKYVIILYGEKKQVLLKHAYP